MSLWPLVLKHTFFCLHLVVGPNRGCHYSTPYALAKIADNIFKIANFINLLWNQISLEIYYDFKRDLIRLVL